MTNHEIEIFDPSSKEGSQRLAKIYLEKAEAEEKGIDSLFTTAINFPGWMYDVVTHLLEKASNLRNKAKVILDEWRE